MIASIKIGLLALAAASSVATAAWADDGPCRVSEPARVSKRHDLNSDALALANAAAQAGAPAAHPRTSRRIMVCPPDP